MLTNILLDKLPEITPNGFKIKTDFRQAIKFELLMQDRNINDEEKFILALNLFYEEVIDVNKQLDDMIWFYLKGKKIEELKTSKESNNQQIYSFEYDADYIFSAFLETYNIDLNVVLMHWWKFKAMFEGLNEKTKLVEIMGYRAIDLSKIKDKEEKKRYKNLKKIYQLPDMRTAEEKEADFGKAFWQKGDNMSDGSVTIDTKLDKSRI